MSSFEVDTAPVTALAGSLDDVAAALADTDQLLTQAAGEVTRLAAPRTPRRTGRLAGSLTVRTEPGPTGTARVRWGVGYAVYVNFGTDRMRARPFATDALAAAEPAIEQLTRAWAADALDIAHA